MTEIIGKRSPPEVQNYKKESIYYPYLSSFSGPNYDLVLSVRHPNDAIHIQETPSGVYLKRQLNQFLPEAFQIKTSKSCKFHLRIVNRSALILVVLVRRSSQKQIVLVRKPKRGLKTGRIDSPSPPPGKPYPTSTKM